MDAQRRFWGRLARKEFCTWLCTALYPFKGGKGLEVGDGAVQPSYVELSSSSLISLVRKTFSGSWKFLVRNTF